MQPWFSSSGTELLRRYRLFLLLMVAGLLAWLNANTSADVDFVDVADNSNRSFAYVAKPAPHTLAVAVVSPERRQRPLVEFARRDPFVEQPTPVAVSPKAAEPVVPIAVAAPVAPAIPSFTLRFAGRMKTPEGRDVVYLADGDSSFPITVGQSLANGYRVEAIAAQAVEFVYPTLNVTTKLEIPEPPKYEIR